jgi:hypothetical protein
MQINDQVDSASSMGGLGNGVDFDSIISKQSNAKIRYLLQCKRSGILYQNQFRLTWNEIEQQVRCVKPGDWKKKEDWQSKVYVPMQDKNSQVARSQMNDILFGAGRFFEAVTDDGSDSADAENLTNLMEILVNRSDFDVQNSFVMQEGIDFGTSFIKIIIKDDGGIKCVWSSTYQTLIDPYCGHDIDRARFLIFVYEKDINTLIDEARKPNSMYNKEIIAAFVKDAEVEAQNLINQRANQAGNTQDGYKQLMDIKTIDGTQYVPIPMAYATVDVSEYWVKIPNEKGGFDHKKMTLLNNKYLLCDEDNELGFLPGQWCRTKKRKYDSYGRGYLENVRGMQDLMNSSVNLGFDSLKINSMDILLVDETKVKDINSIKYKPLAVWKMKDISGARIQRNPSSSITDVLRGATMIDQMVQEATGVMKNVEGAPNLNGASGDTTLGEYEQKLAAVDKRFLDEAKFIENDYLVNLLHKIYLIILNPKLFTQKMCNNFLGMNEVEDLKDAVDDAGKVSLGEKKMVPKLDLVKLREESKNGKYRFRCIGATRFAQIQQKLQKIQGVITQAAQIPIVSAITNWPNLWKRNLMALEMEDVDELMKSKADIQKILNPPPAPPMAPGMPPSAPGQPPSGGMPSGGGQAPSMPVPGQNGPPMPMGGLK